METKIFDGKEITIRKFSRRDLRVVKIPKQYQHKEKLIDEVILLKEI